MSVQVSSIIAAQIYRKDDAPLYRRGNRALIGICVMNLFLFPLIKLYYVKRNQQKKRDWEALSPAVRRLCCWRFHLAHQSSRVTRSTATIGVSGHYKRQGEQAS